MSLEQIDFSKTLTDDQVYESIMNNYSELANEWISHQWNWMNNVYWAFNDHYKYMIVISLIEKTLQFYDQMNIQQTYDEYYSKSYVQIDKFSITELCEKLDLPKETIRRKVLELEKEGIIKRNKEIRKVLNKDFEVPITIASKLVYSEIGNVFLTRLSSIIHPPRVTDEKTGIIALRASVIQGINIGNGKINLVNFFEGYPTKTVILDVSALSKVMNKVESISELLTFFTNSPLEKIKTD